jgi:hypothetical protein
LGRHVPQGLPFYRLAAAQARHVIVPSALGVETREDALDGEVDFTKIDTTTCLCL